MPLFEGTWRVLVGSRDYRREDPAASNVGIESVQRIAGAMVMHKLLNLHLQNGLLRFGRLGVERHGMLELGSKETLKYLT